MHKINNIYRCFSWQLVFKTEAFQFPVEIDHDIANIFKKWQIFIENVSRSYKRFFSQLVNTQGRKNFHVWPNQKIFTNFGSLNPNPVVFFFITSEFCYTVNIMAMTPISFSCFVRKLLRVSECILATEN